MFELQRDTVRRPAPRADRPAERQLKLLTGLDCLPGQQDLFATDGDKHTEMSEMDEAREMCTNADGLRSLAWCLARVRQRRAAKARS